MNKNQKMKHTRIKRKGQVITIDFMVGLLFFIFMLVISTKLIVDIVPDTDFEIVYNNNIYASESLISKGFPLDWNTTNVIIPGITNHYRLNETKLTLYDQISYDKSKELLHSNTEYFFIFKNQTDVVNVSKCIHGYNISYNENCEPNLTTIQYSNLVKTERLLIYNSKVIQLVIYNWN